MVEPRTIYYRFAYSPTTGRVNISHNQEGGPLDIRTHGDLAQERQEQDLIFGYAIRQPDGWHIYDEKNKLINDPNIIKNVNEAIVGYEI